MTAWLVAEAEAAGARANPEPLHLPRGRDDVRAGSEFAPCDETSRCAAGSGEKATATLIEVAMRQTGCFFFQ